MTLQKTEIQTECYSDIDELPQQDRMLVTKAREACESSYSPYSQFRVGAAVLLENGKVVCGSNQENAAFPAGTCAERCAIFYANAQYPTVAPVAIAIAAQKANEENFTPLPVSPCGVCRQVLAEIEQRYNRPIRVIMSGNSLFYAIERAAMLLPFTFTAEAL